MEDLIPLTAILAIFVGMPWLILHHVTKWRQAKSITIEDEDLLDELHDIARRLDERMNSIERIIAADRADAVPLGRPETDYRPVELRSASRNREQ